MKFTEYVYTRPDFDQIETEFGLLLAQFAMAATVAVQQQLIDEINAIRKEFESMSALCYIRHTVDTRDENYAAEQNYFDETEPLFAGLIDKYYRALLTSRFRAELETQFGGQLFALAECKLKVFSPQVVEQLQTENKLNSEYQKLTAAAQIAFDGKTLTLPQLSPYLKSPDRSVRKAAHEAKYNFFSEQEQQFDEIYDKLVKLRHSIAKTLGYANFVELGYARMQRTDYDSVQVAKFRNQVAEHLVPLVKVMKDQQRQRLGVHQLRYYDDKLLFREGNVQPQGDLDWIVERGREMYTELAPETAEFFDFMQTNELLDLDSKPGKAPGGYCSYIHKYCAPFIYSNFNGTVDDVNVLTHEAGHAFQVFSSFHFAVPEYVGATAETAEIHSMSMEYFAWPWMAKFFNGDAEKYKYEHMTENLMFIPYGVAVDEFQHFVYMQPEATPRERKTAWRSIEKKYLPHLNYEGNAYLEQGGYWQQQMHIYVIPFYYIDYTLAQICALQFWQRSERDYPATWAAYLHLCQSGGSQPFTELLKTVNLRSPFEDGCVQSLTSDIARWLEQAAGA